MTEDEWVDLGGLVHVVHRSAEPDAPLVVLIHGLGGSWVNWHPLIPVLRAGSGRAPHVVALDLPGFGLSPGGSRVGIQQYAQVVAQLITRTTSSPAVVLGNSMGGLVSLVLAARHPELLAGIGLLDTALAARPRHRPDPLVSALFGAYFVPGLGPALVAARRRARTPAQQTADTFSMILSDPKRVSAATWQAHQEMAERRQGMRGVARDFGAAARSMGSWLPKVPALAGQTERAGLPVLMLHGRRDRLVPVAAARELAQGRRGWTFAEHPDLGHLPQLEDPQWVADRVREWWPGSVGRAE